MAEVGSAVDVCRRLEAVADRVLWNGDLRFTFDGVAKVVLQEMQNF
jgi:hypothetical protein